jgi:hypothetical protein
MKNNPKTNFGHGIADTDDISIGISDDGQRYVIRHDPSGETVELGPDGLEAGALHSQELSVAQKQQGTIRWIPTDATAADINTIIANATAGDTISFPKGTWTISEPIVSGGINDLTLRGSGMHSTTITVAGGSSQTMSGMEIEGVEGWTISNIAVDFNGMNQTDGGTANNQLCIDARDTGGLEVHHCRLKDSIYANIRVQSRAGIMENVYIHDNHCGPVIGGTAMADDNISLTASTATEELRDWRVSNNYCVDCPHQSIEISSECNHGIVDGNVIVNNTGSPAITTHDATHNLVIGNTVRSTTGVAIHIEGSYSMGVGNLIEDCLMGVKIGNDGDFATESGAYNNTIYNVSGDNAIDIRGNECVVDGNIISNADSTKNGIQPWGDGNTISNNYISGADTGIYGDKTGTLIAGNTINSSAGEGIFYRGNAGHIIGNSIDGAGAARGININDGVDALVGMNRAMNCTDGIGVYGSASDIRLVNNGFYNNTADKDIAVGPTRISENGVGLNGANDPASAGEWNGNGFQGLKVMWDDGAGTNYLSHYLNGSWFDVQLA